MSALQFYDSANTLLYTAPADQTVPGYVATAGPLSNVKTIVLPSTAFYDDVSAQAVPEASSTALFLLSGIGTALGLRRRRGF